LFLPYLQQVLQILFK